ncbi:YraN family protein [Xylanimonas sp. McL0601]|uniref:YraN family protein n=1 Tax=Xylanimonas sp. McL0601 TaxID=3414739 RepID=UPI003CF4363E
MAAKDDVGRRGEQLAAELLTQEGYALLARNWRGQDGELDLVALDGATLVAVEVKTRSGTLFGHPAEAVTPRKIARLRRLTGQWLTEHGRDVRPGFREVRIDVVAVTLSATGPWRVELLRGVS